LAIVDGSGVLCDPNGLDLEELRRLASSSPRQHISEYDIGLLSKEVRSFHSHRDTAQEEPKL
jgi:glutamate dehydrogenase